jgi:hypothetical protein
MRIVGRDLSTVVDLFAGEHKAAPVTAGRAQAFANSAPSPGQLALCKALRINVPVKATKADVDALLRQHRNKAA